MKQTFTFLALALNLAALVFLSSCSKENAYQDDANQQNSLASQQKTQQLDQVIGTYQGKMHMIHEGTDLQVKIQLGVGNSTVSDPDQINKIQVPALTGIMGFPQVQAGTISDSLIVSAMGENDSVPFINGDFNINSSQITLPYSFSGGSTSDADQVIGQFQNGVFSGEWDSHLYGKMGTFSLERSDS